MKLVLVFLLLLGTEAFAQEGDEHECEGCHTRERTAPKSRFSNGLGRWEDSQCYGCHAELNEVAALNKKGQRDGRYYAVPVREDKLDHFASSPLAYMNAPEAVEPPMGSDPPRVSWERFEAFLRRPSSFSAGNGSRAPRMMAYPSIRPGTLRAAARRLQVARPPREEALPELTERERRQANTLWTTRCFTCHGGPAPLSGWSGVSLGLYTARWLRAYASGEVRSPRVGKRAMPVVPLSVDEAKLLYRLFGEMRTSAELELDARVARLELEASAAPSALTPALIAYLWGPFFRDATCVHCHVTSPRASHAFTASAEGLKAYLSRHSGEEFWRRLEIRALEAEQGLVAAQPGMPMAGVELPRELRGLIARWVLDGCKDVEGRTWCRH